MTLSHILKNTPAGSKHPGCRESPGSLANVNQLNTRRLEARLAADYRTQNTSGNEAGIIAKVNDKAVALTIKGPHRK